jgi:hypothetical protein
VALAAAGADVAGIDIVAEVSPRMGFAPANSADLEETAKSRAMRAAVAPGTPVIVSCHAGV